ncbi:MAG: HAD-IB family hydrolase [Parachlamydiaceae bacterium]
MNRRLLSSQSVSAFDLDHTLFIDNAGYRFGRYLCQKKVISPFSLLFIYRSAILHRMGLLSIEQLHQQAFHRLFCGRSAAEIKSWANRFLDEHFDHILYPPAVNHLKAAQKQGHLTVIMSSSLDFLVEPIAARLNVPLWHATRYDVDKYGNFCNISSLMLGDTKASILEKLRLEQGIAVEQIYAYSDSHLDLPFLMAAGNPVGVNPNRRLLAICRKNQWPII